MYDSIWFDNKTLFLATRKVIREILCCETQKKSKKFIIAKTDRKIIFLKLATFLSNLTTTHEKRISYRFKILVHFDLK